MSERPTSRLDQLRNLRARIDQEIDREIKYQQRIKRLTGTARAIVTTRGDYGARIIAVTAAHFAVAPADIIGAGRSREYVQARMVAAWLLRQTGRSYPEIGALLGKDHTTAINACRRVDTDKTLMVHADVIHMALSSESEDAA